MAQEQNKQPLGEHLVALRKILLRSAAAIGIAFLVVFYVAIDALMGFITGPIVERGITVIYTEMSAALMTKLKVAFIAGVVIASPYVFWQIWSFVKPALYEHEKKAFRLTFAATVFLFLLGVMFCYAAVYFLAVDFFLVAGEELATPMLAIDKYVSFLFGFVLPFGLAFELPVALYVTTKMGLTNYAGDTLTMLIGIFIYGEVISGSELSAMTLVWIGIAIFALGGFFIKKNTEDSRAQRLS